VFLANVSLFDFRNYAELDLALERSATVLFGGNAQGKTNLLEAVALTALTRSPRTQQSTELVRFGQPAARVTCTVQTDEGRNQLDVRITVQERPAGNSRATKRFAINGIHRQSSEMIGGLRVVLFWPDDLQLGKGAAGSSTPCFPSSTESTRASWRATATSSSSAMRCCERSATGASRARGSITGRHRWRSRAR
jgi:recombinational DNA repair ATPase RecF